MSMKYGFLWRTVGCLLLAMIFWPAQGALAASVADASVVEGNAGTTTVQVTVNGNLNPGGMLNYQTSDGTATVADNDYVPTSGAIVCASGGNPCPVSFVTVTINGDTKVEPDETFYLQVQGAGTATITILNDDVSAPADTTPPTLSTPGNVTLEASSPGGASYNFVVTASDVDPVSPPVSCTWTSGSTFPLGSTQVDCSATDAAGNTGYGSFTVTVQDTTAPVVIVPADMTVEATGADGATATFTALASDIVDGDQIPVCTPTSGSTFALGETEVSCSATDAAGNTGTASFKITVEDTTSPDVIVPADMTVEATGPDGAVVTFSASASDIVDGDLTPVCTPASGSIFAIGDTEVICSVTDDAGNTGTASFKVTVEDTTAPVVTVPADKTVEATGPNGAVVTFDASASDIVDGDVAVICDPVSGATFALGETTVTCSATDTAGNTGYGSLKVRVEDTTPPVITVPDNMTVEATGPDGAAVTFDVSAHDVVDGDLTPFCTIRSGTTFPLGQWPVVCLALDSAGNIGINVFFVTVEDTTPPEMTVPDDMVVEATGPDGAEVSFVATADDIVSGNLTPVCTPASGSVFALGDTEVTCSVTDEAGNTSTARFTITVQDTTPPALVVPDDMTIEATGPDGAVVPFDVSANDIVDGALDVRCDHLSGDTFPLGETEVSCSATDAAGNIGTAGFKVTVQDTTAPVVSVPADMAVEATGPDGAVVTFDASALDIVDGDVAVTCDPVPGATFALGETTVTCSATDAAGNMAAAAFTITVQDTTAPEITVPDDMVVDATSPKGAVVLFSETVSAKDIVDGLLNVTCDPESGSVFPIGQTTVTCSAVDKAGNTGSQSFTITVRPMTPQSTPTPAPNAAGSDEASPSSAAVVTELPRTGTAGNASGGHGTLLLLAVLVAGAGVSLLGVRRLTGRPWPDL